MPFGLAGAPDAIQALMREVLKEEVKKGGVIIYLDDILIHAASQEEHDEILEMVCSRLIQHGMHLKAAKCAFSVDRVDFLGFRIGNGIFTPMSSLLQGIKDFPMPVTVQEFQRFHGLVNFCCQNVPRYADIMGPISSVMGLSEKELDAGTEYPKGAKKLLAAAFNAQDPCLQVCFEEAKTALSSPATLPSHDANRWTFAITDASKVGFGCLITHDPTGKVAPIAWISGTFTAAERHWHSIHREI